MEKLTKEKFIIFDDVFDRLRLEHYLKVYLLTLQKI